MMVKTLLWMYSFFHCVTKEDRTIVPDYGIGYMRWLIESGFQLSESFASLNIYQECG